MRLTRIPLHYAVALFVLLPASAGVIAVRASATCEKFVRTYVTHPVRNRVSKTTANAWAAWRVAHPNWKPNPNRHRPKYVMTRDEQVKKIELACEVPIEPTQTQLIFETAKVDPPPPMMVMVPPAMSTQTAFPVIPTEVSEVVTPLLPVIFSFAPPPPFPVTQTNTAPPGPTPEPASIMMVGTGLAGLLWIGRRRMLRGESAYAD